MLGDTLAMIRDKIPTVHCMLSCDCHVTVNELVLLQVTEFADSTEAVTKTLDREFKEMNRSVASSSTEALNFTSFCLLQLLGGPGHSDPFSVARY